MQPSVLLCLLVFLTVVSVVYPANPGVKARITVKGINYANSVAQAALAKELKTMKIPNQSGKEHHFEWEFKNIQNRGVTVPTSKITLDPAQHALRWALSNLGIKLHADWRVKYRKGWVKASTSGSVDVGVKGVSLTVAIAIGKDNTGRPTVGTASCSANVGGVDLKFHGGTAWLINLFKGSLERKVRDMLKDQICKLVTKQINTSGAKAMAKLKMTVPLAKKFLLDYRLIAAPVVTSKYLEIQDKGEVFWAKDIKEAPFQPAPIPATSDVSRMFYMWLTEYTANTFAYAAQNHGYLKHNVSKADLPPDKADYFNTTCKNVCIGKLIPQIGQKFPNRQVRVFVNSTSTPALAIAPSGVTLTMKTNIDMFAEGSGKPSAYLLTLNMSMIVSINCSIVKERLVGQITQNNFQFGVVKSDIGQLNPGVLNIILKGAISLVVIPKMNTFLQAGVDLPITGKVKFSNTQLSLLKGSILVGTDLTYVPGAKVMEGMREMTFRVVQG